MNFSLQSMILYGVILFVAVTTGMKNENNDQITQTFRTVTLEDSNSYPWGMSVNFNAIWKKWQITKSSPGKQANTLGIQKDWKIISVDDDDLNEENWKKIEDKLKLGKKMKIKFATNAILCEPGVILSVKENMYLAKHQDSIDIDDSKTGMDGSGLYDHAKFYFLKKGSQLEIIRQNEVVNEKFLFKIEAKLKGGETITFFAEESTLRHNNFALVQRIPQYNQETLTEKHAHFMWNALSYYGKYNKSVVAHMKEEFPHLTTEDVHEVYIQYAKPELEETSIKSSTDIQWNCKSCTFLNNSISKNCEMCENPKTVRAKPELGAASIKPFTDKNQWNCASCTFLNKSFSEKCEMCKKPKTIRVGTLDEVEDFTEHDVNLGNQNENTTPLMSAAANGDLEYVKVLLKHGADVKQASPEGWTALHLSVYYQHFEIIKILLEHDNMNTFQKLSKFVKTFNSQNKYVDQLTNRGYSPLDIAVSKGNLEIFRYLLKHGANLRKS